MNGQSLLITFAISLSSAFAGPVTLSRIGELPADGQPAWKTYLEKSQAGAAADEAALQKEVAANQLPKALKAPDGGDFKLKAKPGDPWFATDETKTLADSILSYQTPAGGWSKHTGYSHGPRKPGMQWTSQNEPGQRAHYVATFDNGSTTSQMNFLAGVWLATKREDCKAGLIKGLDFVFAAQYPNGGWPQVYPLEGGYHDDITLNDDALTHILSLLQGVANNEPGYAFLDEPTRKLAADALARGISCVLRMQIELNGAKTVWCAQNDPFTLQPSSARKMEPATLSGLESARMLKFLMTLPHPTPEVVASIEFGLKWLDQAKLTDPATSEARWARFYDLKTGKPVFPGRDGVLYDTFEAMAEKNETGYDYYTTLPGSILRTGQQKWRKMLASRTAP